MAIIKDVCNAGSESTFDLPGTLYSDDELEIESDEDDQKSKSGDLNPEMTPFLKDLYLVKTVGNFNDSLGKAVMALKKRKGKKGVQNGNKIKDEKPLDYELKHDVEEPDEFGAVSKYMNKSQPLNLDYIIKRVLNESNGIKEENGEILEESSAPAEDMEVEEEGINNDSDTEESDRLKVKAKDHVKKEKKKVRKAKQMVEELQKDKEQFQFEDAPQPDPNIPFKNMGLAPQLMKAINKLGYDKPTPIQASTIPIALKGRDICGCAATGTGKTAAFMLPIFERLIFRPDNSLVTRVLVLVPTRELGVQVFEVSRELSHYVDASISLIVGGLNMQKQGKELKKNPDIIIATPGRLIDHIHNTPSFTLAEIEILVLDEADRMLDQHFAEQLMEIVRQCCIKRQTMLFSATMTSAVKDLIAVSLQKPVRVFVNNNTDVAQNLRQEFIRIRKEPERTRPAILAYLISSLIKEQCIVFVSVKNDCHELRILLSLMGIRTEELHGNLKQFQRLSALQKFRDKEIEVLLATDVAARGLDIPGVSMVINYNLPKSYQSYVHRVGRTARAGLTGQSVTISNDLGKDHLMLKQIQKNSLSPLYERVISTEKLNFYLHKVEKLKPSIERVLEIETRLKHNPKERREEEEKIKNEEGGAVVKEEDKEEISEIVEQKPKLKNKNKPKNNEPTTIWNKKNIGLEELEKEIKRREQNLIKYSAGVLPSERREEKRNMKGKQEKAKLVHKMLKEKRSMALNRIEKEVDDEEKEKHSGKRKLPSNFENELTKTDGRYVKSLRKGPSYLEKKKMFEDKNEGKKFSLKGKPSNYTGADTSAFDNIAPAEPIKPNRAQEKFFNSHSKSKKNFKKKSMFAGTQSIEDKSKGGKKMKRGLGKKKV